MSFGGIPVDPYGVRWAWEADGVSFELRVARVRHTTVNLFRFSFVTFFF